jgi:hypothetical protein
MCQADMLALEARGFGIQVYSSFESGLHQQSAVPAKDQKAISVIRRLSGAIRMSANGDCATKHDFPPPPEESLFLKRGARAWGIGCLNN